MRTVIYRFCLLLMGLCAILPIHAKVVTQQQALETARKVLSQSNDSRSVGNIRLLWNSEALVTESRNVDANPAFFVFVPDNGTGFVIVSGDDSVEALCAYSFNASMLSPGNLPVNVKEWLRGLRESILYQRKQLENDSRYSYVSSRSDVGEQVIMLRTPLWNQDAPFNLQTPMDAGVNSLAGCTPVAIATIMRYYQWPAQGVGQTDAYTTRSKQISVASRNLEEPYQWDKMRLTYINNRYSEEEAQAVARLMADIGCAQQADYSAESTGAGCSPSVMAKKFSYHPGMHYVYRDSYSKSDWIELMKSELILERPILYSAFHAQSGHAMVLDGFTTTDYFHVNWGWGGYCDGFYSLYDLRTYSENYNQDHSALLNFIPDDGSELDKHLTMVNNGLIADCSDFFTNKAFNIHADVANRTGESFSGKLRLSMIDINDKVKEDLYEIESFELPSMYQTKLKIPVKIQQDIVAGDRIRMYYQHADSDKWLLIQSTEKNVPWEIILSDDFSIEESTSVSFNQITGILTILYKEGVEAFVTLNGNEVTDGVTVGTESLIINTKKLPEGVFVISLSKENEMKEFTFELKPL